MLSMIIVPIIIAISTIEHGSNALAYQGKPLAVIKKWDSLMLIISAAIICKIWTKNEQY